MTRDYYQILGVAPDAGPDEIRRAYRARAFELHPDRNGGTREAEEAFKELTEAYAVLGEPSRRSGYDAARRSGRPETGPGVDPADLFQDLFRNPAFASLLSQLSSEFARQGLRFDETYFRTFRGRQGGGLVFGGFLLLGPLTGILSSLANAQRAQAVPRGEERPARKPGLLRRLFQQVLLPDSPKPPPELDVRFELPVRSDVLASGGTVRVKIPGAAGEKTYEVRVPPNTRPGTQLRLPGEGRKGPSGRGDLLLRVRADGAMGAGG